MPRHGWKDTSLGRVERKVVPGWITAYAVSLLALFSLFALILFLRQAFGDRPAAIASLLLLPVWFGAAWQGYGPGIVVCALSFYLAPRLVATTNPRPPDPLQVGMVFALLLLISRLSSMKRRTEESLRQAAETLEGRVAERTGEVIQHQEKLREQAALLDLAREAILTTDDNGVIQFWSRGAAATYGWKAQQAIGQVAHQLLKTSFPEPLENIKAMLLESGFWQGELTHTRRDGVPLTVLSHWALRRDAAGAPCGALEINTDITEQRKVEEQFRHAQKMESIGMLAGGVAHDFNNLLGVIIGFSELASANLDPTNPVQRYVEQIRKAGDKAVLVTRQLLAFSRKQVRQPRALNLGDVARGMEEMLRRLIGENIELSIDVSPDLGVVKVDAGQMEQVIMNLAVNARDAMPQGGTLAISLRNAELDDTRIEMRPASKPGPYVVLKVADTGLGMDAKTQSRIFEPFFSTKPEGKGTGLGLATVFGIVKQNDGNIWVYSEPGIGTTFKIYLPRVEAIPQRPLPLPPEDLRGEETVLVVEDADSLRELAREFLTQAGYRVLTAKDAASAVQASEDHLGPIHLIVTDVVMPGPSGADLAAYLRTDRAEAKVLYMSGYTDDAIGHYGVLDEGTFLLEKPFTRASLLSKVRQVLDPQAASSENAGNSQQSANAQG